MLLDSDILIDVQRGHPPARAWFLALTDLPRVPAVVVMELLQDARSAAEIAHVLALVNPLPRAFLTPYDQSEALRLFETLHLSCGIGLIDVLIAVLALGLGEPLATFNTRRYQHVPGLITVQPYPR
jgi:predicted nucleic acid-binding protein